MDQKRTLWISIASGVFLLVIIGIAIIATKGAATQEKPISANEQIADTSSMWFTTEGSDYPQGLASPSTQLPSQADEPLTVTEGIEVPEITDTQNSSLPSQTENVTVISKGQTNIYTATSTDANGTTTIDLNSLKNPSNVTANNSTAQKAIEETNASRTEQVAQVQNTVQSKSQKSTASSNNAAASAKKTSSAKTNSSATASANKSSQKKSVSAAKSSSTQKTAVKYWVQVSSYTSKKNADQARSILEENKIQCEVFTKEKNNTLYYRLRVGPYTTKDEAEYWLKRVTSIKNFEKCGAYVTQ